MFGFSFSRPPNTSLSLSLALSLSLSSSHLELMESIGVLTLKFSVEFKELIMADPLNGPTLADTAGPTPPPYHVP